MTFALVHHRWSWRGSDSGCTPASMRRGRAAVTWTLAPGQKLTPATRRIKVNLGPGECDDGKSQNALAEKPEFREQNGKLLVSIWLRPVSPGGHFCPAPIEPPLTVDLPEPLGNRELLDGGTYPPQRVVLPRR